jgi:hypothetical protein
MTPSTAVIHSACASADAAVVVAPPAGQRHEDEGDGKGNSEVLHRCLYGNEE